jgi:hypothetical protein
VRYPDAATILNSAKTTVGKQKRVIMLAHDRVAQSAQILEEALDYFYDFNFDVLTPEVLPVRFKAKK